MVMIRVWWFLLGDCRGAFCGHYNLFLFVVSEFYRVWVNGVLGKIANHRQTKLEHGMKTCIL